VVVIRAPLQPRHGKEYGLVMFGYAHGGYLMARMTPSPEVEDVVDSPHARSCKTSRRRRGDGRRPSPGAWSGPARDLREP
jgi:hypothetical protein